MSRTQPYMDQYPNLFSPMTVGGHTFKNRIFVAPTHLPISVDKDGYLTREGGRYYGNFARGGAAAIHMGEVIMDRKNSLAHEDHLNLVDEVTIQSLNSYNEYCHVFGAKTAVELNHSGHFALPPVGDGSDPMSCVEMDMPNGFHVRAMNEEDMDYVAEIYAKSANMAKRGGFDMICMHYGHGWLMGGWLSPLMNTRADRHGGSHENRVRFPRMVLERVREAVGRDMLIEMRISGDECVPGGATIDDAIIYIKMMEDLIDLAHFSAGNRLFPETRAIMHPSHFYEQGHNVHLAEKAKKSGIKIPIGAIGSITDPEFAERVLSEGKADYVLMARTMVADPDWANKARGGRTEDIRPCIKCFRCQDIAGGKKNTARHNIAEYLERFPASTRRTECSVNVYHGNAMVKEDFPLPAVKKNIAVIGGGPAGMQSALEAANRGHRVTLFEERDTLGGQLYFGDHIAFKDDIKKFRLYLERQVRKAGVDIRVNTKATSKMVEELGADAAIVAVGADPFIPPVPGADGGNVRIPETALGYEKELGDKAVIVGGGMTGLELALHLASLGKAVDVIEMTELLAPEGIYTERVDTLRCINEQPLIRTFVSTSCLEVTPEGAIVEDREGRRMIEADTVIFSTGFRPRSVLRDSFAGCAFDVIAVGDCEAVANIKSATASALDAVLRIERS